jgi:hypothetical protein
MLLGNDHLKRPSVPIISDRDEVVSIDVFSVPGPDLAELAGRSVETLAEIAIEDGDFIAGATHASLPALQQPLFWLPGAVPLRRRFVAIYGRWRASGHRVGLAGSAAGRALLRALAPDSPDAAAVLADPAASLYRPALLDVSGDDASLHWPGPVIVPGGGQAQFINIFRTTPDRQARLLEATSAIMPVATRHPGYLRTALHLSLDGYKLANYGQYRSVAQIRAMYFHAETARRFGSILFQDVTEPAVIFGRSWSWRGRPIGTTPRLRCYDVVSTALRQDLRQGD